MPSGRTNNFPWKWAWPKSRDAYIVWHTIEHISKTTWARDFKLVHDFVWGMSSGRTKISPKVRVAYVTWPYNYWHTIEHFFKTIWASDFKFGKQLWLPGSAYYSLLTLLWGSTVGYPSDRRLASCMFFDDFQFSLSVRLRYNWSIGLVVFVSWYVVSHYKVRLSFMFIEEKEHTVSCDSCPCWASRTPTSYFSRLVTSPFACNFRFDVHPDDSPKQQR